MKPKFTKEQLDYLRDCANVAYSNRWKIGKDHFRALDEFVPFFIWSLDQKEEFGEILQNADADDDSINTKHPF